MVSRAQWTVVVAGILCLTAAGPASATSSTRTPEAAARAYVEAVKAHDEMRQCALTELPRGTTRKACRGLLRRFRVDVRRARFAKAFVRGARARLVIDVVLMDGPRRPQAGRSRMLLHRGRRGWRVTSATHLPLTVALDRSSPVVDPAPSRRSAALRRLADDELLALSGNGDMLCALLAPGAPLMGAKGGCHNAMWRLDGGGGPSRALSLARYSAHRIDDRHARLELVVAATRALSGGTRRHPRISFVTTRRPDTVYAVRAGHRWRLVKFSRTFYTTLGLPAPDDVASPEPTATWPTDDAALPSISEVPLAPGCRTPPALWAASCNDVASLAAAPSDSGGLVAWTMGWPSHTRAVRAGSAAGQIAEVAGPRGDDQIWHVVDHGLVPVAGGALVVEESEETRAVRVTAVDPGGRQRAPARVIDPGVENPDDGEEPSIATGAPDATTATVLTGAGVKRLEADGSAAGPDLAVPMTRGYDDALATLPDGTLVSAEYADQGIAVARHGPDGRTTGPLLVQTPAQGWHAVDGPTVAEDRAGHLLIAWREEDDRHRHVQLRVWVFDPAAPTAGAPQTVARLALHRGPGADQYDDPHPAELEVGPRPDGGWTLAYRERRPTGASALWAMSLDAGGAPTGPVRQIADRLRDPAYAAASFALAGDSVAWIAEPRVAGIPQVRAAPLP